MIAAIAKFLDSRNPRERVLIGMLVLVVVPVVCVFLVVLPAMDARQDARIARQAAQSERAWYLERQAEIARLPQAGGGQPASETSIAPVGLGAFDAQLQEAGLLSAVTRLENAQDQGLSISFEAVEFTTLLPWLDGLETQSGYRVAQLRLRAGDISGQVNADLSLRPLN